MFFWTNEREPRPIPGPLVGETMASLIRMQTWVPSPLEASVCLTRN